MSMDWKKQAEALFFIDHFNVSDISLIVKKSRQAVSAHIHDCEGYEAEMCFRKKTSAAQRKEYRKKWDRENRADRYSQVNGYSIKREHEEAVGVLSNERI